MNMSKSIHKNIFNYDRESVDFPILVTTKLIRLFPLQYLRLTKQIEVFTSLQEVKQMLLSAQDYGFTASHTGHDRMILSANISIGTIKGLGIHSFSKIKTAALLRAHTYNHTTVTLRTPLRKELVIIFIFWIISLIAYFAGIGTLPGWIIYGLFPGMLLWFWLIFRLQEIRLHEKIEQRLKS